MRLKCSLEACQSYAVSDPSAVQLAHTALKWGTTMVRTFYYINALAGGPVASGLGDRHLRLVFTQALYEMATLFEHVMQSHASAQATSTSWQPDTVACTHLSVHLLLVLLPLSDALFRLVLRVVDFGLFRSTSAHSVTLVRVNLALCLLLACSLSCLLSLLWVAHGCRMVGVCCVCSGTWRRIARRRSWPSSRTCLSSRATGE